MILNAIHVARQAGARQCAICKELEISQRPLQRWRKSRTGRDGRNGPNTEPANKFSMKKRKKIIKVLTSSRYRGLPPCQIVADLADRDIYLASESTMSRILREVGMNKNRSRAKAPMNRYRPDAIETTGPNQCWTWDITYLKSDVSGLFFYAYVVIDVFSRKLVAAAVHEVESSDLAAKLIQETCQREDIKKDQLTIHSDNGAQMKGATLLATLKELGVSKSFSRPSVSNDNAISEAAFRTMKYRPNYPKGYFQSFEAAKAWVADFVEWYNNKHRHSAIKFVTPGQRHEGLDRLILQKRKELYERQKKKNPQHWGTRKTRDWSYIESVTLNKQLEDQEMVA